MALPTNRTVASTEAEHVADHNTVHTQHNELEGHAADTSVHGIADTTVLATDAEVTSAVAAHAAAGDPHTGYATDGDLTTHAAAADPHAGYLKESVISGLATPAIALGTAAAAGSTLTPIRSDATIAAFDATAPTTAAFGAAAAAGSVAFAARRDHQHGMPADPVTAHAAAGDPHTGYLLESVISALATPAIVLGSAAAAGSGTTPIRHNATIAAFDATNPSTQAFGDAAVVGTAAFAARRDHKHAMPVDSAPNAAWTSFTPTLTQSATVTKTVTRAVYQRVGRIIVAHVNLAVTGSGTAANRVIVGLPPVTAATGAFLIGAGTIYDTSAGLFWAGTAQLDSSSTTKFIVGNGTASDYMGGGGGGFVAGLASGDIVSYSITYEAAS